MENYIYILSDNNLTHGNMASLYIVPSIDSKNRMLSDFSIQYSSEGYIMTNYVEKLHTAKVDYMQAKGDYASVAQAIVNEYKTDTKAISKIVLTASNADYPVIETRDNKVLKTALNSFQNAFHVAGEQLADSIGGKLVFKFSTTGGKNNKSRTVAVEHLSQAQVDTIAARAAEDTAKEIERQEQDAKLEQEKVEQELRLLTDLDVFLRVKKHIEDTYNGRDIRKVLSAGMGWLDEQDANIANRLDAIDQKKTGTDS